MEDIVTVMDGRASVADEVLAGNDKLRVFLRDEFSTLLADASFLDKLTWHLPRSEMESRRSVVLGRMQRIAGI